jgi:hypothetical protein
VQLSTSSALSVLFVLNQKTLEFRYLRAIAKSAPSDRQTVNVVVAVSVSDWQLIPNRDHFATHFPYQRSIQLA